MSEGTKIFFSPKHPVIWFAEYHPNIKELKIPYCKNCNNLIQVKDYNNIKCSCQKQDITWDEAEGAKNISINHFLLEFNDLGEEIINYKYIPLDGLLKFGLLDPSTFVAYGIELLTGYITIGDFRKGEEPFYIATGINDDSSPSNLIKISDAIIHGEAKVELKYAKRAIVKGNIQLSLLNFEAISQFEMDPENIMIENIAVGYVCKLPKWDFEVIIRVDCNSHLPYFTSKATPNNN